MKSISLYVEKGSWLNKLHPYTKLLYILTAIMIPLTGGKLWLFPVMIVSSLILLLSGKIIKRATQIDKGDIITIKFSDGEKNAEIL